MLLFTLPQPIPNPLYILTRTTSCSFLSFFFLLSLFPSLPPFHPPSLLLSVCIHVHILFSLTKSKQTHKAKNTKESKRSAHRNGEVCVSQLLLATGPALECGWYTHWHSAGGNDFSSSSRYQLLTASWLEGTCTHFPISVLVAKLEC